MKLFCLVIALAFVATTASDSWGQSKQPSPKASQQTPAQQDRGTEKAPVVVKVLPAEKSKDELESEKAKEESERQLVKLTGDLANYTKFLFIATGLLFVATGGLIIAGFRQLRDAKRQLLLSRQVERAYVSGGIIIEWGDTNRSEAEYGPGGTVLMRTIKEPRDVVITVSNHGKTPAYITEMDVQICKPADLPKLPDYANCDVTLNLSIGPGIENVRTRKQFGFPEAAAKIIYGRIHYRDIFGDTHMTGFIFQPMASGVILTVESTMARLEYTPWD
jgi:hypothetical protein